jgi:hypothetical protein
MPTRVELIVRVIACLHVSMPRATHIFGCSRNSVLRVPEAPQVPSACIPAGGSGWLAVGDSWNRRVQVVTLTGQVIRVLVGDADNGLGQLSVNIRGITVCVDTQGDPELLVADSANHRVVAFRLDGSAARLVCGTGQAGRGAGELNHPIGLAVTATGDLWVVDHDNHRMSLFR